MNKNRNRNRTVNKILTLIMLVVLMFTVIPAKISYSFSNNTKYSDNTYNNSIELKKNISFSGVNDSYAWNFNIDKNTNVKSIKTIINFETTDILDSKIGSYLTFLVNGTEFYSKKIESNNDENQSIVVEVPLELLKDGFNEFKVEGYLRVTDMPCTDDLNSANWLVIKSDSKIDITQSNRITSNIISELPYPIVNMGGYERTKIIISNTYTDGELTAALKLQGLIGRDGGSADIVKTSDVSNLEKNNIVYIGKVNEMPGNLKAGLGNFNNISEQAYINITKSPVGLTGEEKILYILSESDKELISAVKFIMNKELVKQVNTGDVYINSKMQLDDKIAEEKKNFTFKELGYNQKAVEGLFRSETAIDYVLPQNKRLAEGDTININFRYSENLDFDRSLFTVYVNGNPVASKKLEKENANSDNIVVTIPKDAINTSYFEIKFAFDLLLKDVNCEIREQNQPWALIRDDSTIQINDKDISQFNFNTYPAPFISNWDFNDTLLAIPDNLSSSELTAIGNMIAYMGKQTKYNIGDFEVISSRNIENQHKEKNIIVYGTPENNKLIKDLSKDLWLPYNSEYTNFVSNEKITLMEDFSKRITTFQLDVSPYNNQRNMLVLTSPRNDLLEKSLLFFSDDKEFYKLSGDGAVVDEYGNVTCFKYKEEIKTPTYKRIIELNNNSKYLLIILVALAFFIIFACILYNKKHNNKKMKTEK